MLQKLSQGGHFMLEPVFLNLQWNYVLTIIL